MKEKLLLVAMFLMTDLCLSKDYLVLFRQAETSISTLDHGAFQNLLQTTNQKSIDQLRLFLGGEAVPTIGNLWLIRGAVLPLTDDEIKKLVKEPWVRGIFMDRSRKFVSPTSQLVVKNSLKEFNDDPLWGLNRIGLNKIKEEFPNLKGTGIRVGVLDTGIQSRHPEFLKQSRAPLFRDFVNSIASPYDDHGHGTHVAGTIGGGTVGLAPDVTFIVGKIFTAAGSGQDSIILRAMQWMFDPDGDPNTNDFAQIVSNSWGADLNDQTIAHDLGEFEPFRTAVEAWIAGGIIPVFAAGNSGSQPNGIPGGLPEPISVGALSPDDTIAPFSSRGPNIWRTDSLLLSFLKPDITAPGVRVASAFPGNKYATWAGTSMATPHVTGSIALLLQANHKLKFSKIKELILLSSEKKIDVSHGYGILNAYQLIKEGTK